MKIRDWIAKARKKRKKKPASTLLNRMRTADDPELFIWPKEPKNG